MSGFAGGFDWPGLMRLAFRGLGVSPAEFWALTPAELRLMLGQEGAVSRPLSRARLMELAAAFPDRVPDLRKGTDDGGDGRAERA